MSTVLARGAILCVGDDVNTDYIVPSHRKKETIDPQVLRRFMFEDVYPDLAAGLGGSTILVAGRNFGCGSAMEVAVTVPKAAGIRAIVARSFSRTYRRNAVNNGLLALTADTAGLEQEESGEIVDVDGTVFLRTRSGRAVPCDPVPPFLIGIVRSGGLVAYLRERGSFPASGDRG